MKHKPVRRIWIIWLVLALMLPQLIRADMADPGGNITLSRGDFGPVGGFSSATGVSMTSASRPPSHLTREDYQTIRDGAKSRLEAGIRFRLNEISIVPSDTITNALKNYADFNDGELFYRFCADYDQIDERGYCPDQDDRENVRNKLVRALALYAILLVAPTHATMEVGGETVRVTEVGRTGVLSATREIANVHLIFGNEFLIDATDYRFSTGGIPNADIIIGQELDQLEQALQQFQLATDIMSYAFNTTVGGEVRDFLVDEKRIGDYFTSREFELFGVASNRMMTTMGEMAVRYRLLGQDEKALALYDEAYTAQYMQAMALAQKANELGADYLQNGSWEMLNNLSQMRERAQAIRAGTDPFGFAPDYVPLQSYQHLLELTEGPGGSTGLLWTARDLEDQARDAQRTFDGNKDAMDDELDELSTELDDQLFDLCGESKDDYDTCEGGLMEQNLQEMYAASLRTGLAWQRAEDTAEQIRIEEERAGQVINVTLGLGQTIGAAELAIGKLEAYRTTKTSVSSSEDQVYAGVEASARWYVQTEVTVDANPLQCSASATAGFEASLETTAGYQHAWTWTDSTETQFDPNAEAIAGYESMKAIKEAEAEADIEGANSDAVIKNLLLQQSEQLLEHEIAMEEFNKLAAEHNHLAQRYSRLLNDRALVINRVVEHNSHLANPAYRVMRDTLTVQAAEAHAQAAQFAYLTARAAGYDLMTPYPNINEIYKARTSNDIRLFLDDLKIWHQAPTIVNNPFPYRISIAQDILGLTDQNLDPDGTMTPGERDQLRYERFQEFLQGNFYADGTLEFQFATSLDMRRSETQPLFSENIWGNRIAGVGSPLPANQGVAVNILTRQTGDVGTPEVKLTHGGQASYRNPTGSVVHLDPGPAVPVGYVLPPGLDPVDTTVVIRPGFNKTWDPEHPPWDISRYSGFENLSIATSSWTFRIPVGSSGYLDHNQVEDIEIWLDSAGRAIQGRERQAEQDALRLQAGLELESVPDQQIDASANEVLRDTPNATLNTLRTYRPASLASTDVVSGSYSGNVVITSPLPVGVQVLSFDLVDLSGVLSGTVNTTRTAIYSGTMGVYGVMDGDAFTITSDVITSVVAGRLIQQSFTLVGHAERGGEILKGVYTGAVTGFMVDPIIVEGTFSGSRPSQPGGSLDQEALVVEVGSASVLINGSTSVAAYHFDSEGQPVTQTTHITFTTDLGTVTPQTTNTVDGIATATFTAEDTPGSATITATTGWLTSTTQVDVVVAHKVYLPLVLRYY